MKEFIKNNWRKFVFWLLKLSTDFAFKHLDENKDGSISKAEWDSFFKELEKNSKQVRKRK